MKYIFFSRWATTVHNCNVEYERLHMYLSSKCILCYLLRILDDIRFGNTQITGSVKFDV
jgi:hypothetical protein